MVVPIAVLAGMTDDHPVTRRDQVADRCHQTCGDAAKAAGAVRKGDAADFDSVDLKDFLPSADAKA
jgi:hypothetical protein